MVGVDGEVLGGVHGVGVVECDMFGYVFGW